MQKYRWGVIFRNNLVKPVLFYELLENGYYFLNVFSNQCCFVDSPLCVMRRGLGTCRAGIKNGFFLSDQTSNNF
jgi:hypothetical protein